MPAIDEDRERETREFHLLSPRLFHEHPTSFGPHGQGDDVPRTSLQRLRTIGLSLAFTRSISLPIHLFDFLQYYHRYGILFILFSRLEILLGDTVTKVLHRLWPTIPHLFQNRYVIICLCSCLVTLPLSLYRNIAKLSQISLTGLILVFTTVLILIKRGYDTTPFL